MTKEEIQLELTKLALSIHKPQIVGTDASKIVVDIYKQIGEELSSPKKQTRSKQSKA